MRKLFITGIGTDVGKTIVATILTEALQADYWKPIQAGVEPQTDSEFVKSLISNSKSMIHPESFVLKHPMSPHAAAQLAGVDVMLDKIILPRIDNTLIIEGAGGLMVPLNDKEMIIDLIQKCDAEVILVIKNYLGSINHSLLSIELLKKRNIPVLGIIISGEKNEASENIIFKYSGIKFLGRVEAMSDINKENIQKASLMFKALFSS